jgi:L-amino acid N-acyltransferase YncA
VGRAAIEALVREAEARGLWKLVSRFPRERGESRLCRSVGFREVGVYGRHARLDGEWRDGVVVELLLGEAANS